MTIGRPKDDAGMLTEQQGNGQSVGVLADGQLEGNAVSPLGNPGVRHWQATYLDAAHLDDRGNIFFAAVEMTRMPMLITDPQQPDNPIVFVNGAFLDLTQYREEQVLGRNCRLLQGPDTDRRTVDEVRQAVAEERAVAVDILNYKADGTPFWNALFIGPIFDKAGKLLYFFASQMDITQRRIHEQSYLQAQKMEAIGQLTAGLAHDFNNLLQVVNGNLELAQRMLDNKAMASQAIGRAQRAALKGGALTQQLLTFARKQRLEPRRINLNALVLDFAEMLVRTLGQEVQLHLDLRPGLPPCVLDPTHLEMALLNVLINARDAMPAGGEVTVGTSLVSDPERVAAHRLPPGHYVSICVIDHGIGMAPHVLQRATEPFFTTKGPGTGLGLAMVHGFVQQSQGRLEIDSKPDEGTTVRMLFPVADQEQAPAPPLPDQQAPTAGGLPTILLVEDNDDVRQLAQTMLETHGYPIVAAASGEEALRLLDEHAAIGLLFSDVIMPGGMSGLQLAEETRHRRPALPVLLATGYMEQLPNGARPAFPVLPKPYKESELLSRVADALAGQGARPHPASV
ncbi:PAS domain S-box-containing protein [Pseudoduganella flava]|uniref:histidine kinase n=1 Tax=Pseudoduganella flava TaxID=871742 RepID=A0A562PZV7_9BURK|nr:histidine kinase famiy protein [Pseudoduganella flava]QGZ38510.1 PAS domain-containing protein [Pseudoduganella flava]TWI49934.1 PAS domain S-box-containing protein [Pseudoduganella flava]